MRATVKRTVRGIGRDCERDWEGLGGTGMGWDGLGGIVNDFDGLGGTGRDRKRL